MEGNKDDAEKCIELATKYLREGNREKAENLLLKSERLYPTNQAKELLEKIRTSSPEPENVRRRSVPQKEEATFKAENKENVQFSKDHTDAVKRIQKCKNYYEMLGVTKESSDNEIKKAYKKLALQLHPDKNKSPGAVDAFKALGNAAGVLTDPQKRKQYDMYGGDEGRMRSGGDEFTQHHYRGNAFEADVSAEELFNMFFGAGFPAGGGFTNTRRTHRVFRTDTHQGRGAGEGRGPGEGQHNSGLVQLLPILVLIMLSMMSSFFVADPIYSLHNSSKFPVERKTLNLKIPYYVKENFANEYQGSLRRLEMNVEEEFVTNLRHACYKEKTYRDSLMYKARTFSDRELYMKAQNQPLPSCDQLSRLHQG